MGSQTPIRDLTIHPPTPEKYHYRAIAPDEITDLHLCRLDGRPVALLEHRWRGTGDEADEHRSTISRSTACRLMDGVLARNFSHAIWHCASSVLSPQHVSLTCKTHGARNAGWIPNTFRMFFVPVGLRPYTGPGRVSHRAQFPQNKSLNPNFKTHFLYFQNNTHYKIGLYIFYKNT